MLNPKFIRNNPELVKVKLQSRKVDPAEVEEYLQLDRQNRDAITKVEGLKKQKNQLTEQVKQSNPQSEEGQALIQQVKKINGDIKSTEDAQAEVSERLNYIAIRFPNLPADDAPVGPDEDSNVEMRKHGDLPTFDFKPKAHWELGESLGILDFDRAAKVAGARFVYYKDAGALLERAVYSFMLDLHTQKQGYHEIIPPYLVNANTMYGTGQFPKFKEDVYTVESSGMTLIPTAEVPLTNYYANEIMTEDQLPTYLTAMTPCYRSEAGSAGRDTRGLIRMHQFHKVEMVKFCKPENSYAELEKLTDNAEEVLRELGLSYHVIELSTGDTGFSSAKTYDVEVWMPEQGVYREISSCSNCLDFQARRAMMRYRKADGTVEYVHTLNGSGLAVGRTVAAILENFQQADGTVKIPAVLQPYMHGMTEIK